MMKKTASPLAGLFTAPNNPDPGLSAQVLDNPEEYPDPNAVQQRIQGVSGTPLFGGAGPRQLGSVQQAHGMIAGGNGQQQPLGQSILRTLWNSKQMTPQGAPLQKAAAPGPAAVNTFAAHAAQQAPAGQMTPPIGAGAPGIPGRQDIQAAAAQGMPQQQHQVIARRSLLTR